jgi:hypothetical protein
MILPGPNDTGNVQLLNLQLASLRLVLNNPVQRLQSAPRIVLRKPTERNDCGK